jgi:hypothetical protein
MEPAVHEALQASHFHNRAGDKAVTREKQLVNGGKKYSYNLALDKCCPVEEVAQEAT